MPREECALLRCAPEGKRKEVFGGMEMLKSGGRKVVGTKQVLRALKAGTVSRVYAASDADTFIYQQVVRSAEDAHVPCVRVPTMKELGMICGVEVPAAAAGLLRD
jgi:large subunit ribosomal protein L7A